MIYRQFGIELVRLEKENIEMLRHWRNAPEIVKNMEFQAYITSSMQEEWFEKINNIQHFYFLIKKDNEWLGLIHLSNIDYHKKIADAGIFISNQSYINTSIPAHSSFALLNFAFGDLGLKSVYIKVNKNNTKALKYNQHLGFLYTEESINSDFIIMKLSHRNYDRKTLRLRKAISRIQSDEKEIHFNLNNSLDKKTKDLLSS